MAMHKPGDLIWAKMKGFPAWPAMVLSVSDVPQPCPNGKMPVLFYGTNETAIMKPGELFSYPEYRDKYEIPRKLKDFNQAIREIRREAGIEEEADFQTKFPISLPKTPASKKKAKPKQAEEPLEERLDDTPPPLQIDEGLPSETPEPRPESTDFPTASISSQSVTVHAEPVDLLLPKPTNQQRVQQGPKKRGQPEKYAVVGQCWKSNCNGNVIIRTKRQRSGIYTDYYRCRKCDNERSTENGSLDQLRQQAHPGPIVGTKKKIPKLKIALGKKPSTPVHRKSVLFTKSTEVEQAPLTLTISLPKQEETSETISHTPTPLEQSLSIGEPSSRGRSRKPKVFGDDFLSFALPKGKLKSKKSDMGSPTPGTSGSPLPRMKSPIFVMHSSPVVRHESKPHDALPAIETKEIPPKRPAQKARKSVKKPKHRPAPVIQTEPGIQEIESEIRTIIEATKQTQMTPPDIQEQTESEVKHSIEDQAAIETVSETGELFQLKPKSPSKKSTEFETIAGIVSSNQEVVELKAKKHSKKSGDFEFFGIEDGSPGTSKKPEDVEPAPVEESVAPDGEDGATSEVPIESQDTAELPENEEPEQVCEPAIQVERESTYGFITEKAGENIVVGVGNTHGTGFGFLVAGPKTKKRQRSSNSATFKSPTTKKKKVEPEIKKTLEPEVEEAKENVVEPEPEIPEAFEPESTHPTPTVPPLTLNIARVRANQSSDSSLMMSPETDITGDSEDSGRRISRRIPKRKTFDDFITSFGKEQKSPPVSPVKEPSLSPRLPISLASPMRSPRFSGGGNDSGFQFEEVEVTIEPPTAETVSPVQPIEEPIQPIKIKKSAANGEQKRMADGHGQSKTCFQCGYYCSVESMGKNRKRKWRCRKCRKINGTVDEDEPTKPVVRQEEPEYEPESDSDDSIQSSDDNEPEELPEDDEEYVPQMETIVKSHKGTSKKGRPAKNWSAKLKKALASKAKPKPTLKSLQIQKSLKSMKDQLKTKKVKSERIGRPPIPVPEERPIDTSNPKVKLCVNCDGNVKVQWVSYHRRSRWRCIGQCKQWYDWTDGQRERFSDRRDSTPPPPKYKKPKVVVESLIGGSPEISVAEEIEQFRQEIERHREYEEDDILSDLATITGKKQKKKGRPKINPTPERKQKASKKFSFGDDDELDVVGLTDEERKAEAHLHKEKKKDEVIHRIPLPPGGAKLCLYCDSSCGIEHKGKIKRQKWRCRKCRKYNGWVDEDADAQQLIKDKNFQLSSSDSSSSDSDSSESGSDYEPTKSPSPHKKVERRGRPKGSKNRNPPAGTLKVKLSSPKIPKVGKMEYKSPRSYGDINPFASVGRMEYEGPPRSPSPLPDTALLYQPTYVETGSRWWLANKKNKGRTKSPPRIFGADAIDCAGMFKLVGQNLKLMSDRLKHRMQVTPNEDESQGTIDGTLDLLMDTLMTSLGPLLTLTSFVPNTDVMSRDQLHDLWESTAIFTPIFQ